MLLKPTIWSKQFYCGGCVPVVSKVARAPAGVGRACNFPGVVNIRRLRY